MNSPQQPNHDAQAASDSSQPNSSTPIRPEVVSNHPAPSRTNPTPPTSGAGRRWMVRFIWIGCIGAFMGLMLMSLLFTGFQGYFDDGGGIQEGFFSGSKWGSDKIAIINIKGVIASGEGYVKRQIDRVKNDGSVKAVVLRVDSPGGTITGSDYIYHHLNKMKEERQIPIVVSMGSMAASGGYYVAMAVGDDEDTIFAEPTTTTGSIGVIIPHYDLSGLLERYDVKDDSLVSHPRKQMLSMTRPIDPDDRKVLEAYLQEAFKRFKQIVRSGRPKLRENEEALNALATGEIFTATQAQQNGLVDQLGFIEEAIDRAAEMANLNLDDVRVVSYKSPVTLMDVLIASQAPRSELADLKALLDLSVPRAYYLATSLPPLVSVSGPPALAPQMNAQREE